MASISSSWFCSLQNLPEKEDLVNCLACLPVCSRRFVSVDFTCHVAAVFLLFASCRLSVLSLFENFHNFYP
uniref:Uncharacterized protein n=1 Tax=Anguilla anguilla TaxID=7936 RepID=A0A0E9VYC5_ANGAN